MRYVRGFLLVLLSWYILAFLIQEPIIPYPHYVFAFLILGIQTSQTHLHLGYSLFRITMGIVFALVFAIPIGMLAGRTKRLDQLISPALYLLYPLPKIAFLPVFMVLFGIGDLSKIMLIAVIIFFPAALNIRDGVKEIPLQYLELAKAYHPTNKQVLKDIVW
ncbi:MAG: ABC transporter permease subunit, partial [Spirochaetia bacterium]|nr:ABC transporter permease subunit [Spirochaetia bacterium]